MDQDYGTQKPRSPAPQGVLEKGEQLDGSVHPAPGVVSDNQCLSISPRTYINKERTVQQESPKKKKKRTPKRFLGAPIGLGLTRLSPWGPSQRHSTAKETEAQEG